MNKPKVRLIPGPEKKPSWLQPAVPMIDLVRASAKRSSDAVLAAGDILTVANEVHIYVVAFPDGDIPSVKVEVYLGILPES